MAERIFREYYNGLDLTGVARKLNALGLRTKTGNRFDRRSVERILKNRFYLGEVIWNGITFTGAHEARPSITSIFEAVQNRLESEYRPLGRREVSANAHWLSGLLRCSVCGGNLGYNRSNNPKRRPDFFQCWKYAKGVHPESCAITARRAEAAVIESLRQVISTGQVEYEYIPRREETAHDEESDLRDALARLSMKETRVRDAYENGIDTLEEYRENRRRLNAERDELTQALDLLHKAAAPPENIPDSHEVVRRIQTVYDLLISPDVDFAIKGNALRSVVKYIEFDRRNDRIFMRYYIS